MFGLDFCLSPDNADAYFNRSIAYSEFQEYQAAIADAQKAAQLYQQRGNTISYKHMQQVLKLLELEDSLH